MSGSTEGLTEVLHDGQSLNYYTLALTTLYFYDYLLTLPKEVKYAWKGRKTFVFYLFFANRYIPFTYRVWNMFTEHYPGYTQDMCDRTAFIHVLSFHLSAWISQLVMMSRIFAVSGKNRPLTLCLATLSTVQLSLGCWQMYLVATTPALPMRPVPNLGLQFCILSRHKVLELTNTVLSIPFDMTVFGLTVYFAWRHGAARWSLSGGPGLFHTLVRDGAIYFLFILVNHVVFTLALIFGRPYVQVIPAVGIYVYIPIAVSRLMLSLRKAADQGAGWLSYSRSRNQFVRGPVHLTTEDHQTVGKIDIESICLKEVSS